MTARRLSPMCRHVFALVTALFLVPANVDAQSGSVTFQGTVSETVALSILPNFAHDNFEVAVIDSGSAVRLSLSSTDPRSAVIRVPLLVRSNSSFKISAVFHSQTAVLTELSVIDVRSTGNLVSPEAVHLAVRTEVDLDVSRPLLVLSGPRVSLAGTLNSPNNALRVTLLIRMKPASGHRLFADLTFIGTAVPLIQ